MSHDYVVGLRTLLINVSVYKCGQTCTLHLVGYAVDVVMDIAHSSRILYSDYTEDPR